MVGTHQHHPFLAVVLLGMPDGKQRACLALPYAGSRAIAFPKRKQRRPIIRSTRTLRIRQGHGLNRTTAATISPFPLVVS